MKTPKKIHALSQIINSAQNSSFSKIPRDIFYTVPFRSFKSHENVNIALFHCMESILGDKAVCHLFHFSISLDVFDSSIRVCASQDYYKLVIFL